MQYTQKVNIIDKTSGQSAAIVNCNGYYGMVSLSPGHISTNNSTETPLTAGSTFTGTSEEIVNFGVIQVMTKASHASATNGFSIEFSTNNTDWDTGDTYTIDAATNKVYSFQPSARYFRIKYINGTDDQTYFRLQTIIKPYYVKPSSHRIADSISSQDDAELVKSVLSGINQDDEFVNIQATYANSLKTSLYDGETGRRAEIEPLGALKIETPVRLVGTTFSDGTKDTNFWTETVTGTGSVTQAGEIVISTGTTADSTAKYTTVQKSRKITGTTNQFRAVARNVQAPAADCIRRIGAYDDNNGFFLQFDGETFGIGSRKSGVDTVIENGSFNGNAGSTIDFGNGIEFTKIIIEYTALSAMFFIDGTLIHTITAETASLTTSLNLPATMEIINENGNTTNSSYEILFATILRLGELNTEAIYKFINTNTTTVCKYNAGRLQRILNVDNAGSITIYDNTAATGTIIAEIDTAKALGTLDFDISFSNGLTVVTENGAQIVVIYE